MACVDISALPERDLTTLTPGNILSAEHQVILQTADCLDAVAARSLRERSIPADHAAQALEIIRRFADQCHHGKEEQILFAAIEEIAPGFGPVQVMLRDHETGRASVRGMALALAAGQPQEFARHAGDYTAMIRDHIAKEDQILFRWADANIPPARQAQILDAFRAVEHDDMGDGVHERLIGLADSLATYYGFAKASRDPNTFRLLTAVCGCAQKAAQQA
jgi:hemerythrin-like domain-containing protein